MLFSFFNRFASVHPKSSSEQTFHPQKQKESFIAIADECSGNFYENFKLYHHDTLTTVDILLFLPNRGIYFGEILSWSPSELKGASVERSSKRTQKSPTTRLENSAWRLRQKLEDILSFDSTPIERFFWMKNLTETDFDELDPSFHELMPKGRLIFSDDAKAAIQRKFEALTPYQSEPISTVKVMGSLNAHTLLLPTPDTPFGAFLSDEQLQFLDTECTDTVTTLYGTYGSGKSTLLLRKAIKILLNDPKRKVLIITPTLLAGELLRNKLISLMEYGAWNIPLDSISFYTPHLSLPLDELPIFEEASVVFCDDAYRLENTFTQMLRQRRGKRWLVFGTALKPDSDENLYLLNNHYRDAKHVSTLQCTQNDLLSTLLEKLRKRLIDVPEQDIMIILPEQQMLPQFKESIDNALHLDCRTLIPGFSLQYQNLDDVILVTGDYVSGLRIPHLFLIVPEDSDDYAFELSRASESATIITLLEI
ncbi:hypothetical protein [Sulfuricurvum sp.]|uniref:hypothetical protein n=1 Tax=Sulfuricurvum sp. TaxID=2025608 RepID=UPI003C43E4B0